MPQKTVPSSSISMIASSFSWLMEPGGSLGVGLPLTLSLGW
jgi:hypothetical protein